MKKNNNNQEEINKDNGKKPSSALAAAAKGGRATDNIKPKSTRDISGKSGTVNTGTNVSYEDRE